jgi:hypothetical protein
MVTINTIKKRTPAYSTKPVLLREEAALFSTVNPFPIIRLIEDDKAGPIDYFVM